MVLECTRFARAVQWRNSEDRQKFTCTLVITLAIYTSEVSCPIWVQALAASLCIRTRIVNASHGWLQIKFSVLQNTRGITAVLVGLGSKLLCLLEQQPLWRWMFLYEKEAG